MAANAHERFMEEAIAEARKSLRQGGIPIGSVLVKGGRIIGRGHNRRVQKNDPIMHAEIDCLRNAGRIRNYKHTTLYSTLMPCYLCSGALVQFGIKKVVAGESRTFHGARGFMQAHGIQVLDLGMEECRKIMQDFIKKHPKLWKEDIGKS